MTPEKFIKEASKQKIDNNPNWSKKVKEYLKKRIDDSKNWNELTNIVAVCLSLQYIAM